MSDVHCAAAPETDAPLNRRVIFTPFAWHCRAEKFVQVAVDGGRVAEYAGGVRDVSAGVRDILGILERDALDASCCEDDGVTPAPALLSAQQTANLTRLAIWTLDRLQDESDRMVDYLDNAQPITGGAHCPS